MPSDIWVEAFNDYQIGELDRLKSCYISRGLKQEREGTEAQGEAEQPGTV